jgi:lysophospholipase L1-like esterase
MQQAAMGAARWIWLGAIFFVTLEFAARVDDWARWRAPFTGRYAHEALVTRDSVTIRGRAGYRYEKWSMNSDGFRGKELLGDSNRVRVVTLGASETFGLFESEGNEYPAQLQRALDSLAPGKFEVVNAALPGMSLAAMRPYLQYVVAPIQPDYVVLYPSPSFFLEIAPPADSLRLPPWNPEARASVGESIRFELTNARLLEKTKVVVKRILPLELLISAREKAVRRERKAHGKDWVWSEVPSERMEIFEQQLVRVLEDIDALGADAVLVTHVNRFLHRSGDLDLVDRQHLLAPLSLYWPRAAEGVVVGVDSAANRRMRELAHRRALALVDAEGRIPADAAHFADYSHFTDEGARMMASLISDALAGRRTP